MYYVRDFVENRIDEIPSPPVRTYLRPSIEFAFDLQSIVQADPATLAFELLCALSLFLVPHIITALLALICYDAY